MSDHSAGMPPGFDPYKTLQVDPEADPEVIQAAYRRLAQKFHPDLARGDDAAARMIAINAAWELLGDPERRAAFDRQRAAAEWAASHERDALRARPAPQPPSSRPGTVGGSGRGRDAPGSFGIASRGAPPWPDSTSSDWTSGRSTTGGGYDPNTMRAPEGHGAAGPPPGNPSGSVVGFGRFAGWSLGEIARVDAEYLEWLDRAPIGRAYRDELDVILRRLGRRRSARRAEPDSKRGLFRR